MWFSSFTRIRGKFQITQVTQTCSNTRLSATESIILKELLVFMFKVEVIYTLPCPCLFYDSVREQQDEFVYLLVEGEFRISLEG